MQGATMARVQFTTEFAGNTVAWATDKLELTLEEVSRALGVNRRTVERWRQGSSEPSPVHRRNLERVNQLRYLLETSFRDLDAAQRWLHTPLPALRGLTPLGALEDGRLDDLTGLLATLESGAHR